MLGKSTALGEPVLICWNHQVASRPGKGRLALWYATLADSQGPHAQKSPVFILMFWCYHIEIGNNIEQKASHFYFALNPTNYVFGAG